MPIFTFLGNFPRMHCKRGAQSKAEQSYGTLASLSLGMPGLSQVRGISFWRAGPVFLPAFKQSLSLLPFPKGLAQNFAHWGLRCLNTCRNVSGQLALVLQHEKVTRDLWYSMTALDT